MCTYKEAKGNCAEANPTYEKQKTFNKEARGTKINSWRPHVHLQRN